MKHVKKKLLFLANKLIEKIPDSCNTKEHYQSFTTKKKNQLNNQKWLLIKEKFLKTQTLLMYYRTSKNVI